MVFNFNKQNGCLILLIFALIMFLLFRFTWVLLFKTPLGLALVVYVIYKYYKRSKQVKQPRQAYRQDQAESVNDEIEVDYEEYD